MVCPPVPACPVIMGNRLPVVDTNVKCPAIVATKSIVTNSVVGRRVISVAKALNVYASTTMLPFASVPRVTWAMRTPTVARPNVRRTETVRVVDLLVSMAPARICVTVCVA
jgi:hypothetical protein